MLICGLLVTIFWVWGGLLCRCIIYHLPFVTWQQQNAAREVTGYHTTGWVLQSLEEFCYDGSVAAAAAGGVDAQIHLNVPFWTLSIIIYWQNNWKKNKRKTIQHHIFDI